MKLARVAFVGVALVFAGAAEGQVLDPDAVVVDTLVVRASVPRPPWWKVQHDGRTVYIFAEPPTLPRKTAWDRSALERRIGIADLVISAPVLKGTTNRGRAEPMLDAVLSDDLRYRLAAVAGQLGRPVDRYTGQSAMGAAKRLTDASGTRHN